MQVRASDYTILAVGVCAVSTAALLIREADAPALVIAAYRLTLASVPLLAMSRLQRQTAPVRDAGRTRLKLLAGLLLALHFVFWIASVKQTSVATSVFLVTTSPLFVAVASGPLLGERPVAATWFGIAIAAAGAMVMISNDFGTGQHRLLGDLYALLGAIFAAGYYIIGRKLRTEGETWLSYVSLAYSTAACILLLMVLVSGDPLFAYSVRTFVFLVLLAAVPQLIGHTVLNRSLGYLPAITVSMAVRGEPVGATILAAIFLNEMPAGVEVIGALLVLAGVYIGLRAPPVAEGAEMKPATG